MNHIDLIPKAKMNIVYNTVYVVLSTIKSRLAACTHVLMNKLDELVDWIVDLIQKLTDEDENLHNPNGLTFPLGTLPLDHFDFDV